MSEFKSKPRAASLGLVAPGATGRRRRRPVAQRRAGPPRVVLHPPPFDHEGCFLQRVKGLTVQALVPQLPVEALAVPFVPGTSQLNVQRRNLLRFVPLCRLERSSSQVTPLSFRLVQKFPATSKRYAESAAATEEALQLSDNDYRVWSNLGVAYRGLKKKDQATAAN